jgi:hypothetical protein
MGNAKSCDAARNARLGLQLLDLIVWRNRAPLQNEVKRGSYFLSYPPPVAAAINEVWSCLNLASSVILPPSGSVT